MVWLTMLAAIFVLLVIGLALAAWFIRAPVPKVEGTIIVSGLGAPVTIRRDARGVPHIDARSETDAYFAEGFAAAQDRLWQMDTLRRQAEGRVSEIAGEAGLDSDVYMRTLGFDEAAAAFARSMDPRSRAALEAYAAGVNAAAASHPLPIEFKLVGYGWRPWTPKDTFAIVELEAQQLDDQWYYQTIKADLVDKFGLKTADALVDMQLPALEHHIPGYARTARAAGLNAARVEPVVPLHIALNFPNPTGRERGSGSNNWVVSGSRTSTGRPVLSNDTHLSRTLPSIWWIVDLHGGPLHAAGLTLPGLPGVVIGHNERIAWGITSAEEAVQDLYVERFRSATSDEYVANGRWIKAKHRVENIAVKGQPDVVLDVLITRHGPIIRRAGTQGIALAWTVLNGSGSYRAVLDIDTARNYQAFRKALSYSLCPVLNFGYADVDGNIGYQDSGAVPLRARGDGSLPVEGQDDLYAWRGTVPYDELPHALNPPAGHLETANQELVPPSFRPILSTYFEPPFRVNRIATLLSKARSASPEQIGAIQADVFDYPRLQLARATGRMLANDPDPALRALASRLASWDGMMTADSRIPTFVVAQDEQLTRDMFEPALGEDLYARYDANYWPIVPLLRALSGDDRARAAGVTRASVQAAVVRAARESLSALGPRGLDGAKPWGRQNEALYRHPLSAKWFLSFLSPPPVVQPGSGFAIYAAKPKHGPSQRLVVDLSNFDNTSMLVSLGESGVYSDPHYDDQLDDYTAVRYVPVPFSQAAV
ncbi:MAG: penicillin acylase family protein, partial [Candidatus Eremiobacteraeota bacterium]|nr:penicillin acylase family protein [Candidatus Eremiobacteraeota bacterium]